MMLKRVLQKNMGKRKRVGNSESTSVDDKTCASFGIPLCAEPSGIQRKRRREELSIIERNVKLKKPQAAKDSHSVDKRVESMDYISLLPDAVIHHILSFLRSAKDAPRTSVLSKRWRDMWTSFSALTFDQRKYQHLEGGENCIEMFKEFIDKSLRSHLERNLGIHKFVLHLTSYDEQFAHHMKRWIGLATENKIKELGFHVHINGIARHTLPENAFAAETLTGLRLQACKLETCNIIKLPHLQKLYLRNTEVDELIIQNFISSCPLIGDLRLIHCTGLKFLQISGLLKLDRVEVHYCYGLKKIEIKAANLRTFWFCGKKFMSCKINLVDCASLKTLTLEDNKMTGNHFRERFFSFPLLEKLELVKCLSLKNIRIASHRLKCLVLRGCENLVEAEIDTPNLLSFEYQGDDMRFTFLNPTCLKEAKLSFKPEKNTKLEFSPVPEPHWILKLREFLGKFDHKDLKLVVRTKENIVIHENHREILLPSSCGFILEIVQSSGCTEELLDNSLQRWQSETLSIVSSSSSELPELICEKLTNSKEDQTCCASINSNNKCWRHFLKDAKRVKMKACRNKDHNKNHWIAWLKSRPNVREITCFRLNWKSDNDGQKASC